MIISNSHKPASGIDIPVEIEALLDAEFPNGAALNTIVNAWIEVYPWATLWIVLNYNEPETVVEMARQMAEMTLPYVDPRLRAIAKGAAAIAAQSLSKVSQLRDQVAALTESIDSLETAFDDEEAPDRQASLAQAIMAQQIDRNAIEAAIAVHVKAVHDMAVTAAIHGTTNHQAELYVISSTITWA